MMNWRRAIKLIIIFPLVLGMLMVAIANRVMVPFNIEPFTAPNTPPLMEVPLYLVMFGTLAIGVVMGGIAMWFSQSRHRKALRVQRKEVEQLTKQRDEAIRNLALETEKTAATLSVVDYAPPSATPLSLAHV